MPPTIAGEMRKLYAEIDLLKKEVRSLKTWRSRVGSGSGIRAGTIIGSVPVGSTTAANLGAVSIWTNASGAPRTAGEVVVWGGGADRTFIVAGVTGDQTTLGVLIDDTATGADGHVRHVGYTTPVKVDGAVTPGDYLEQGGTPGQATSVGATPTAGCFALALTGDAAGEVAAYVFVVIPALAVTAGSSIVSPDTLTDVAANDTEIEFRQNGTVVGQWDDTQFNILNSVVISQNLEFSGSFHSAPVDVTIVGGVAPFTEGTFFALDTEGAAASDDVDSLEFLGDMLFIRAKDDARTIVLKHNTGATGDKILSTTGTDITLDTITKMAMALWNGEADGGNGAYIVHPLF